MKYHVGTCRERQNEVLPTMPITGRVVGCWDVTEELKCEKCHQFGFKGFFDR